MVEDDKVVLETYKDDDEWRLEKVAFNSSLCDLEWILAKEDLSLKDFSLPVPNMEKEKFIQECLQIDCDIAEENDLSVEKAKIFTRQITLYSMKISKRFSTSSKILFVAKTRMGC